MVPNQKINRGGGSQSKIIDMAKILKFNQDGRSFVIKNQDCLPNSIIIKAVVPVFVRKSEWQFNLGFNQDTALVRDLIEIGLFRSKKSHRWFFFENNRNSQYLKKNGMVVPRFYKSCCVCTDLKQYIVGKCFRRWVQI